MDSANDNLGSDCQIRDPKPTIVYPLSPFRCLCLFRRLSVNVPNARPSAGYLHTAFTYSTCIPCTNHN